MTPMQYEWCPHKKDPDRYTGRTPHEDERSPHVMLLEAQDCQRLPINPQSYGSGPERILLHSPQRDPTLQTPQFQMLASGTVR